jgi:hypothetical protein
MSTVQMSVWVPVIAALAGGLVASIAPIVVGLIQSGAEHQRELVRLATQLAIEEQKAAIETAKMMSRPASISPIAMNFVYHLGLLRFVEKGSVSPADMEALQAQSSLLFPK